MNAEVPAVFMTVSEAASYLRLKVSTIYGLKHRNKIPSRKHGGRLIFLRSELDQWSICSVESKGFQLKLSNDWLTYEIEAVKTRTGSLKTE